MNDVSPLTTPDGAVARAARHAELLPRLRALEAIPKWDRSAVIDTEIDDLRKQMWSLEQTAGRYGDPPIPGAVFERMYRPPEDSRRAG